MGRGSRIDHYRTLGVPRDASTREIRRAYRRLVRQHHPDVNQADDARRFVAITDAYQVLNDPVARARYDRTSPGPPAACAAQDAAASPGGRPHRSGVLELSLEEATHLAHHRLTLTNGASTIRLPAGLGHGDTIELRDRDYVIVLRIAVKM